MNIPERGKNLAPRNIRKIYLIGGTHGNERTGFHAVKQVMDNPEEFLTGGISKIHCTIGNPRAVAKNVRYIEKDLNRSFRYDYARQKQIIAPGDANHYETKRALEIRREFGALEKPSDFGIDLHTTTANMGNCLIISDNDPWTLLLCSSIADRISDCHVLFEPEKREDDLMSSSLGLNHITLEMGPIEQGVAHGHKIKEACDIVKAIVQSAERLNGFDDWNSTVKSTAPMFLRLNGNIDYIRSEDQLPDCIIHPEFMGRDYSALSPDTDIFLDSKGKNIKLRDLKNLPSDVAEALKAGESLVPIFIGESAYI